MKNYTLLLCLILISSQFLGCNTVQRDAVNGTIGDISFFEKFGFMPDAGTDNNLRIKTHLQYVEHMLRSKDVSHLSGYLKLKRSEALDLLRSYAEAGQFPKNFDYPNERKSCFIDRNNNICAVGYLIEKTAGRKIAENINQAHQYDSILEMDNEAVDRWIAASGLTKQECAMIQPTYQYNNLTAGYGISSALLMGTNATLSTINVIGISKHQTNIAAPILGLATGAAQITIGAIGFADDRKYNQGRMEPNVTPQGKMALFNIGAGTTTLLLSTWNLLGSKKASRSSWGIFSPAGSGLGISFKKNI